MAVSDATMRAGEIHMTVVVVDDDHVTLEAVTGMLRSLNCRVRAFDHPVQALDCLSSVVDVVVSDVTMPDLDGFAVAHAVSSRLGVLPPRTLLMSGEDHSPRLERSPPSSVIGLLLKPISFAHVRRVFDLLAQTRTCCPGVKMPFCPYVVAKPDQSGGEQGHSHVCHTVRYAQCPHYDTLCGKMLRCWIAGAAQGTEPAAASMS